MGLQGDSKINFVLLVDALFSTFVNIRFHLPVVDYKSSGKLLNVFKIKLKIVASSDLQLSIYIYFIYMVLFIWFQF